ncbi:calcium-binding protein [Streptomyces sp. 4N509B]|uniref:calcium-binding protein n=1 Tax=Streptomyces sp. 4N509B TaxID=3457413 RepID=UPI003FD6A746
MRRSIIALGALVLATVGLTAPQAHASEAALVAFSGGHDIHYTAGPGEANDLVVLQGPGGPAEYVFDDRVPITAGEGCEHPFADDPTYVVCTLPSYDPGTSWTSVVVELLDGDDQLGLYAGDDSHGYGGDGDDILDGEGAGWLYGDAGNDTLRDAGVLYGGTGRDTLYPTGLGEGGPDDDRIIGRAGGQAMYGGDGVDVLRGLDGADHLYGEAGDDRLYGGADRDELSGGEGDDALHGQGGDDLLLGGPGTDLLDGGSGTNELLPD